MLKPLTLLYSHSVISSSLRPHELQHSRLPCPSPSPRSCSNSCPLSEWCHPTISFSVVSFSSCFQSFPASESFLSQFFASGGQSIGASVSASVLLMNSQDWFLLGLTGLIPLQPRESQESFPTPQFKSTNSSVINLLYGPNFTSIHDYWKNHSFDYTDLCWQSNISTFKYAVYICHNFSSKEQLSFNFMAAVTICSDFGAQENKICHCFHCFPSYLPWSDGTRCHDLHFLWITTNCGKFLKRWEY